MEAPKLLRQHWWFGDSCSDTADRNGPVRALHSVQHSKEGHDGRGVPKACQQWQVRNERQIGSSAVAMLHLCTLSKCKITELLMCSEGYAVHVMTTLRSWKGNTGRMWHLTLPYMGRMLTGLCMTLWVLNLLGVVAHQNWSEVFFKIAVWSQTQTQKIYIFCRKSKSGTFAI